MQNIERAADAGEAHEYFSVAFWLHRMKAISAWRLVAISRLVLALFALLAIYIDPTQPTRSSETVYLILAAYVVYSGALAAILERFAASHPAAYLVHGIDILTFGAVIRLTDGPTSPFFVFLTFALFAATIRWGWRGAAFTTLATVGIYGTLAALSDDLMNDFNRVVMRSVYLSRAFCSPISEASSNACGSASPTWQDRRRRPGSAAIPHSRPFFAAQP
jgi:hypothetical protein